MSRPLWSSFGAERLFHSGPGGEYAIEYRQDVQPILDENKARQNYSDGWSPGRHFKHVAHIPDSVLMEWMKQDGVNMFAMQGDECDKWIMRRIRDADYKAVRACKEMSAYRQPVEGKT